MARPQAAAKKSDSERQVITTNRKARHDYEILETFEAGIELRSVQRVFFWLWTSVSGPFWLVASDNRQ